MTRFAYVFPGQGSQSVGMMSDWGEHQGIVDEVYEQASAALGYDLWAVTSQGPLDQLNQTEVTQPAMLCAGVASWRIINQQLELPPAAMMAGHSLGEYSALVCAGSLDLNDAATLTYPEKFARDKREVKLDGEGYFDVAKDAKKPFTVGVGSVYIDVLGTSFEF